MFFHTCAKSQVSQETWDSMRYGPMLGLCEVRPKLQVVFIKAVIVFKCHLSLQKKVALGFWFCILILNRSIVNFWVPGETNTLSQCVC